MFCQICGANLRSTARYCNHCGKPVAQRFVPPPSQPAATTPAAPSPHQPAAGVTEAIPPPTELVEWLAQIQTDQLVQRGTERQPPAKSTGQDDEVKPLGGAPPGAITNVNDDALPKESFGAVSRAATLVEDLPLDETPAPPELSTEQLQLGAKPFFTQLLSARANNQQHTRLARAVPLVVLILLLLLIFAYVASK